MFDDDAWKKYHHHHKWFNKLWLAEKLGYECGPTGVSVPKKDYYIFRPIYNLSGMGVGAERRWLVPEHDVSVPGYFWCEYFDGDHFSIDFKWHLDKPPFWRPIRCHQGIKINPQRIERWVKWNVKDIEITLPHFFHELSDVGIINVETIDNKIIEVHLRPNPDPDYDEVIPVFSEEMNIRYYEEYRDYEWIENYDDADGALNSPRCGFLVR